MRHCLCFYFYLFIFLFLFFVFVFVFPKSAQVGLRLPDTRTSTATKAAFYSIYVDQEKGGRQEERWGKSTSPRSHPPQGDLCAKHNGSVCSPTTGSTLVNILLVFLRHLFWKSLKNTGDFEIIQSWQKSKLGAKSSFTKLIPFPFFFFFS